MIREKHRLLLLPPPFHAMCLVRTRGPTEKLNYDILYNRYITYYKCFRAKTKCWSSQGELKIPPGELLYSRAGCRRNTSALPAAPARPAFLSFQLPQQQGWSGLEEGETAPEASAAASAPKPGSGSLPRPSAELTSETNELITS